MNKKRTVFTLLLGISGLFALWYNLNPLLEKTPNKPSVVLSASTLITPSKPIINFSLIDTEEKPFTNHSLLGHWTLLFFGYADCPDTCPKTLAVMSELWKILPNNKDKNPLRLAFISLDPKSDTPQHIRKFLDRFHPSFIGLTGNESMIQTLSKDCGIYYWQDPNSKQVKTKMIDHSATVLLINPAGQIQALFSPPYQQDAMKKDLEVLLH